MTSVLWFVFAVVCAGAMIAQIRWELDFNTRREREFGTPYPWTGRHAWLGHVLMLYGIVSAIAAGVRAL